MLSKEANKEDTQRSIVSLHFILHRGYSPLPLSVPNFTNNITRNALKSTNIDINGVNDGYMDRYVYYIKNNKV